MNRKIIKQEATYDFLKDEIHCLYEEKKELQQRIDKAIEMIEKLDYHEIQDENKIELLDILKGSDSNE